MNKFAYTYCVVKYMPDPATGEALNIGVILCTPSLAYIGVEFELRYERLSDAFAKFYGEHYRKVVRQIENAVLDLKTRSNGTLFELHEPITDAQKLSAILIPDKSLSFQLGPMLAGLTDEPRTEIKYIFNRMVTSQYNRKREERRSDEDIWHNFFEPIKRHRINRYLQPVKLTSDAYDLKFDHALKNERWRILQPVSMDFSRAENIQAKATKILGTASALSDNSKLAEMFILLGAPKTPDHAKAYYKAKNLLHKIPVKHELIEEDEAEDFANVLESYIQRHGIEAAPISSLEAKDDRLPNE